MAAAGCNKARRYPTISARNPDGGNVSVHGSYNFCPNFFFSASPDHADVGQTIALSAVASDAENDPLTYAWSASSGTIDDPKAATTTFHCTTRGAVTLTLIVSDGVCGPTSSGVVLCQSEDAGAPDGGTAGASGGGGQGGSIGPGGTSGQAGTSGQGGTTGQAGTSGQAGTTGSGGTTGVGTAGAQGPGGTTGTAGTSGGGACLETNPPPSISSDCMACLMANENPLTDGCCALATSDPIGYTLCQAASACMRAGGPPVGACNVGGDITACFCGTNLATCTQPGGANGPCVAQITAAGGRNVKTKTTDSPTAAQLMSRSGDPAYASGRAGNIHLVAGSFCQAECEIGQ